MEFRLTDQTKLKNLPSGSGLAKLGEFYYVVGDDAPYLFCLNADFEIIAKIQLLENADVLDARIQKHQKPDFECLEAIGAQEMVVFGSGSKSPERDVFVRILLEETVRVVRYKITEFYELLRSLPIMENSELNIEAVAFHNQQLYLFNRKKNLIIRFDYQAFLKHLNDRLFFPEMQISAYHLPEINGIEAGFSGATISAALSKIIFTATVEDTDNAYDDGEILGSLVGTIDLIKNEPSANFEWCAVSNKGEKLKVESVVLDKVVSNTEVKLVFVTDDDRGNSLVLRGLLSV